MAGCSRSTPPSTEGERTDDVNELDRLSRVRDPGPVHCGGYIVTTTFRECMGTLIDTEYIVAAHRRILPVRTRFEWIWTRLFIPRWWDRDPHGPPGQMCCFG